MKMVRGVLFHRFPAFPVVQLHPIILSVLDLAGVLQSLRKQIPQIVVVGGLLEPKISDIAQVLVEFLCH